MLSYFKIVIILLFKIFLKINLSINFEYYLISKIIKYKIKLGGRS